MGDICQTVTSRWGTGGGNVPIALAENTIGRQPLNGGNGTGYAEGGPMYTLNATGVHGVAYGFEPGIAKREGNPARFVENGTPTLRANMGDNQTATAYSIDTYNLKVGEGSTQTLRGFGHIDHVGGTMHNMAVRRLTPIECERLQGFPDDYTNIREKCPDGPRYKAMGNSMAVPVMRWIGQRIKEMA
jgi:DNA (cytosine-5)-methyltransferase 1